MSYTLTVRTENGTSTVLDASGVPDGEHVITGHDDDTRISVGVQRRGADGRFIASAQHTHATSS